MRPTLQKFLMMFGAILVTANISASAATDPTTKVQKQSDGVLLTTPSGTLRLQVWSDRIVRVTFAPENKLPAKKSFSVIAKPVKTKWKSSETPDAVILETQAVRARVDKKTGAVDFLI
jgi:alpha-D-xyloside xylohydrolase